MLQVQFHEAEGFLEEMAHERHRCHRDPVRVIFAREEEGDRVGVTLHAGTVVGNTLVRLSRRLGECSTEDERGKEALVKASTAERDRLLSRLQELGLEVRSGYIL